MRFESVTAHAFGPFLGKRLDLAPGMNVIFGPNESGKSTLHAAAFAALCGRRRGRGQPPKEEREFAERHRPWDGNEWSVSAVVTLEDGRRVELHHDLDGGVDCAATDVDLGRDYSAEIINDGAPDGARWLGLDRRSFLSTACVRQAEILGVRNDPAALREHLQRAAATAGTDATLAEALERIEEFRRQHVGLDRANSTRPLRRALDALEAAREGLLCARAEHDAYVQLVEQVRALEATADEAQRALRRVRAAIAGRSAAEWARKLARARALAAAYSDGPPSVDEEEALPRGVAGAITAWDTRPEPPHLEGESAEALRIQLVGLSTPSPGYLEVDSEVAKANQAYAGTRARVESHDAQRRPAPTIPQTGGAEERELGDLARALSQVEPRIDPGLEDCVERAKAAAAREPQQGQRTLLIAASVVLLAAGVWLAPAGLLVAALGVGLLIWTLKNTGDAGRVRALQRLRSIEAELHGQHLRAAQTAAAEWSELQVLLDGRDIDELAEEARRQQMCAEQLSADLDPIAVAAVQLDAQPERQVDELTQRATASTSQVDRARGELQAKGRNLVGVPEAEESVAAAEAELKRLGSLDHALAQTRQFLLAAQDRVHRDIAPKLAATVRRWLGEVTDHRYTEVAVDPESLEVRVRGQSARWRRAALLSHGTAEQIYLLLRVALAQHLVTPGEVCPLVLDDVAVQCDAERKEAVLQVLRALSRDRQVVLFTQETSALRWAEQHLALPRDRVQRSDPPYCAAE